MYMDKLQEIHGIRTRKMLKTKLQFPLTILWIGAGIRMNFTGNAHHMAKLETNYA